MMELVGRYPSLARAASGADAPAAGSAVLIDGLEVTDEQVVPLSPYTGPAVPARPDRAR